MSVQASVIGAGRLRIRATRALPFRLIPRIETYPAVVAAAQTVQGQFLLLFLFALLYGGFSTVSLPLILCLALITWMPANRSQLVGVSTIVFTLLVPWTHMMRPVYSVSLIVAVLAVAVFLIWCVARWPHSKFGRNPALLLLFGFSAWIVALGLIPKNLSAYHAVWDFTIVFGAYIWFIGYVLLDRQAAPVQQFGLAIGTLRPFWGSTYTPFPNGSAYLRTIEANDSRQLAVTQLKGLKLMAWATLISLFSQVWMHFFHDRLAIPLFSKALQLSAAGTPLPWFVCWAGLILFFLEKIMAGAVLGHRIIACCRMAGYDALRNVYRPLSSVTVAEFFNRYYFYYKELLATFFFYPVFLSSRARRTKFRLAISIFAAACFGNVFYHFIRDLGYIQQYGLWVSIKTFQVFFFYCVVLATAITFSRLRRRKPAGPGFFRRTLCPAFSVCFFYCLLSVFSSTDRAYPLVEHLRFLGHLFFLS